MFGEKKCFTSANDNDYYCHAFRGWPHTKVKRVPMNARHCSHCFQYYLASLMLAFFSSYFEPWVRWLRSLTPVTYLCMLPGICLLAALLGPSLGLAPEGAAASSVQICSRQICPQLKLFRKMSFHILSRGFVGCVRSPRSHTCVCSRGFACLCVPATQTISKNS